MANIRTRTLARRRPVSPELRGNISDRSASRDGKRIDKGDARFDARVAGLSAIKAAYAKEIASLENEIAALKDRFDHP